MKFVRPTAAPRAPGARGAFASPGRPQWLIDWIADKGKFVKLACGHNEDLNDRCLIVVGKDHAVLCERCNTWTTVEKSINLYEYHTGKEPPVQPDEPPF